MPDEAPATGTSALRLRPGDHAWEQFPDPHGRPTTPVRILKLDDPYLLEADFPPNFYAGIHWHPHDTIYLITAGELRFGDEGWFRPGDIRWVRGGHAYGPETAGAEGVRFFLISLGGPVGLNWADLYEVPGELKTRLAGFSTTAGRLTIADRLSAWPASAPLAGVRAESISDRHPPITRLVLDPGATLPEHHFTADVLCYVRSGALRIAGDESLDAGDFRWTRRGTPTGSAQAGSAGADLLLLGLNGPVEFVAR